MGVGSLGSFPMFFCLGEFCSGSGPDTSFGFDEFKFFLLVV